MVIEAALRPHFRSNCFWVWLDQRLYQWQYYFYFSTRLGGGGRQQLQVTNNPISSTLYKYITQTCVTHVIRHFRDKINIHLVLVVMTMTPITTLSQSMVTSSHPDLLSPIKCITLRHYVFPSIYMELCHPDSTSCTMERKYSIHGSNSIWSRNGEQQQLVGERSVWWRDSVVGIV